MPFDDVADSLIIKSDWYEMSNATNNIHVVQYEFAIVLKINPLKDCKFLNQTMCYIYIT